MTKVRELYQALVALSEDGHCEIRQDKLAQAAGISVRHLKRLIVELREMGLIRVNPIHDRKGYKILNRYTLSDGLGDSRSPLGHRASDQPKGHQESPRLGLEAIRSPLGSENQPKGHQESQHAMPCHAMDGGKEEILKNLDFIDEPRRSQCAARLAAETALAWRQVYDYYTQHDAWQVLGIRSNPVGVIIHRIEHDEPPWPLQIPLPGGAVDLGEFTSRGMTREEIQATLGPTDGATLGEDGVWR